MYFGLSFQFFLVKIGFYMFLVFLLTKHLQRRVFWTKSTTIEKKYLEVIFPKIRHIQIQIYPQTYIEPKYGAFYLKNEVSAHGLVLVVQLS